MWSPIVFNEMIRAVGTSSYVCVFSEETIFSYSVQRLVVEVATKNASLVSRFFQWIVCKKNSRGSLLINIIVLEALVFVY